MRSRSLCAAALCSRVWPAISTRPADSAAPTTSWASAVLVASGFSTRTCLPASMACRLSRAWVDGEAARPRDGRQGTLLPREPRLAASRGPSEGPGWITLITGLVTSVVGAQPEARLPARRIGGAGRDLSGPVHLAPMVNVHDGDHAGSVIDPVDDPVRATACAEPVVQRRKQALADAVPLLQQRASDELVRGGSDRRWQGFAYGPPDGRRGPQQIQLARRLPAHPAGARRCCMTSASSSAETDSPRASSASDAARRPMVSALRKMARVSSSRSRSSTATRTAEGRPWTVTVTRS